MPKLHPKFTALVKESGVPLDELAKAAGLSTTFLESALEGKRPMVMGKIDKLEEAFGDYLDNIITAHNLPDEIGDVIEKLLDQEKLLPFVGLTFFRDNCGLAQIVSHPRSVVKEVIGNKLVLTGKRPNPFFPDDEERWPTTVKANMAHPYVKAIATLRALSED